MHFLRYILFLILLTNNFSLLIIPNNIENSSNNHLQQNNHYIEKPVTVLSAHTLRESVGVQWLLNQGFNGTGIRICIIDTGIYNTSSYTEVSGKVIAAQSFVTIANGYDLDISDPNPSGSRNDIHGTWVASLAAGTTKGTAPGASLINAKIFHRSVPGNAGVGGEETTKGVTEAIKFCAANNASVINLSIGQYNNVLQDGRQQVIDEFSRKGIVFTISAGNDGSNGIDGASIGMPGTAFQAITVGASTGSGQMAFFSSSGIRPDYTFKPDLVAPGVGLSAQNGSCTGTSCSSPVIAGGIAVLLEALNASNRNYTVGTIKAALVATAAPLVNYPPWYQGAGMVNFTAAYNYLMNADTINSLPQVASVFPKKIPVEPLNKIFIDQQTALNLTVVTSGAVNGSISITNIPENIIQVVTSKTFNDSSRLNVIFSPQNTILPGNYSGNLIISLESNITLNVELSFEIGEANLHVLFDETKNGLVNQLFGSFPTWDDEADPWGEQAFLMGQFREFYKILADRDIAVTPFQNGSYTDLDYLMQFNVLIFPYPFTSFNGRFTDWWNDPEYNLTLPDLSFTNEEQTTLSNYLTTSEKGILLLSSPEKYSNVTAMNNWLSRYQISLRENSLTRNLISVTNDTIFNSVSSINFYGTSFDVSGNATSLLDGKLILQEFTSGGRLAISGSGYFAENHMLTGSNAISNCNFVLNLINWAAANNGNSGDNNNNHSTITQSETETSTSTGPSQTSTSTSEIPSQTSIVSSTSTTPVATNTGFDMFSVILIVTSILIVSFKRKNIFQKK